MIFKRKEDLNADQRLSHRRRICLPDGRQHQSKFYALCHNYESGLNGKGRTLFCRESPATSGTHTTSARSDYRVDSNNEDTWYKNTYVTKFSDEVKDLIGTTKYVGMYFYAYQYSAYEWRTTSSSKTYESRFFSISATEVGALHYADGSALSSAAISRISNIRNHYGSGIWTRTPTDTTTYSNHELGNHIDNYANSVYISSASDSSVTTAEGTYGSSYGYLPASPCRRRCTSTKTASPLRTSRRRSLPMRARAARRWARRTSRLLCPTP